MTRANGEKYNAENEQLNHQASPITGGILTNLWRLSWPVMLGMLLHSTLAVVDTFFVSRLGDYGIAAISLSGNIFWLLFTLSEVINVGTVSMVSRFVGTQEPTKVRDTILHSILFSMILALMVSSVLLYFSQTFIELFTQEANIISAGTAYLRIMAVGMFILFLFIVFSASFQGAGDTKTPMKILFLSNALNIILNPFFIFGLGFFPRLEVMGAGAATLTANTMALLILSRWFTHSNVLPKLDILKFRFNPSIVKNIFSIGFPAGIQAVSRPLTGMILMYMVSIFGDDAITAFGVGQRALSYSFIVSSGLMVATTTMIGQGLGIKDLKYTQDIAVKSLLLGIIVQGSVAAGYFLSSGIIMDIFITESQAAIEMGTKYLRIIALGIVFTGPIRSIMGIFKGAGYTIPGMMAATISNCLVKLPLAYGLAFYLGLDTTGVWWAITASMIVEVFILYLWYLRGTWMYREIHVTES